MVEERYDSVIRVNPDPDDTLVGRILFRDRSVLVASPTLTKPVGNVRVPAVVRGVGGLPASHDAGEAATDWEVATPDGISRVAVDPILRLSSLIMVRDAVRAGVGVGRLPMSLVGRDVEAGTLVHWGDIEGPEITLWALYPSRRLLSARVSAFLEHLKKVFPVGTSEEPGAYVASRKRREAAARKPGDDDCRRRGRLPSASVDRWLRDLRRRIAAASTSRSDTSRSPRSAGCYSP